MSVARWRAPLVARRRQWVPPPQAVQPGSLRALTRRAPAVRRSRFYGQSPTPTSTPPGTLSGPRRRAAARPPRGRTFDPQWTPPSAQAPPFTPPVVRRPVRLLALRRGHQFEPPWPQQAAPAPPAFVPSVLRHPVRPTVLRRGHVTDVPAPQPPPQATLDPARRQPALRARRGRAIEPPWPQAVAVAPAFVPPELDPARRPVPARVRRGVFASPPWLAAPPAFAPSIVRPVRRVIPTVRRGTPATAPAQAPSWPQALSRRPQRLLNRRGAFLFVPPQAAVTPAPTWVPQLVRPVVSPRPAVRRGRVITVPPIPAAPLLVPPVLRPVAPVRARLLRRGRISFVPGMADTPPRLLRRTTPRLPQRRGALPSVVPPAVAPPLPPIVVGRHVRPITPVRRGAYPTVVPAQVVVAAPAIVPTWLRQAARRQLPVRRGALRQVVPAQVAAAPPVLPPASLGRRVRPGLLVRRGQVYTVPPASATPVVGLGRVRRLSVPVRRGVFQAVAPAQLPPVPGLRAALRRLVVPARRGTVAAPPWTRQAPSLVPQPIRRVRLQSPVTRRGVVRSVVGPGVAVGVPQWLPPLLRQVRRAALLPRRRSALGAGAVPSGLSGIVFAPGDVGAKWTTGTVSLKWQPGDVGLKWRSPVSTQYISASSVEPLRALGIAATLNNVNLDPTIYLIEFAITDSTTAAGLSPSSWVTATWETGGPPYDAWCMVGPGTTLGAFAAGLWRAWWRITVSSSEKPIHQFGFVQFT